MTIPPDPQGQGQPPVGGPPGQGGLPPYPGQYGGEQHPGGQPYPPPPGPYPEPGQHGRSYGGQETAAYPYDPYARQYSPVGAADQSARRPGVMGLALVLMILSALPYLAGGVLALVGAGFVRESVPPEQLAQFEEAGVDPGTLVLAGGVVLALIALVYLVLAVLAFQGRNWARIVSTVMTVAFVLLAGFSGVLGLAQGAVVDVLTFLVLFGPALLALIGAVLLFVPAANRFFADRGR